MYCLVEHIKSRQQTSWVLYNSQCILYLWLQASIKIYLQCRTSTAELDLQTLHCRCQSADYRLQNSGCRPQCSLAAELDLQTSDCRPQTVDLRLQNSTCRAQNAEFRLRTSQSAELDLQTSDCRLHTANWWLCDWYLERLRITFKTLSKRVMVHMGQRSKRLELIPVSFAWSMQCLGVLLLPLDRVLVHHRLTPSSMLPVNLVPILNTLSEGRHSGVESPA